MQRLMYVLLVACAACGGGDGGSLDFPDASASLDAPNGTSDAGAAAGLVVEWVDAPALPGPQNVPTMVNVTSAKFHIKKLEVIGDGGSVPETTADDLDVLWNATSAPPSITFFSAPPAIYSKVRLGLDKGPTDAPSIEVTGTMLVGGTTEMFRVSSKRKLDLEVTGYAVTLRVGESQGMPVIVGLDVMLGDVDWMSLPVSNTVRVLEDASTTEMDALFGRLVDTFTGPNE